MSSGSLCRCGRGGARAGGRMDEGAERRLRNLACSGPECNRNQKVKIMRLFEAIIDANHRAVAGDASAGLHPADFADALPVIALTCIDPRLNAFFPNVLALAAEDF